MCVILSAFYLYSQFTYRVLSSSFHECISIQLSFLVLLFWSLFGVTKVCMWRCKLCCRDQLMRFYHSFTTQISNSKWFEGENVLSKHGHLNKNEQTANKFSASLFFFLLVSIFFSSEILFKYAVTFTPHQLHWNFSDAV